MIESPPRSYRRLVFTLLALIECAVIGYLIGVNSAVVIETEVEVPIFKESPHSQCDRICNADVKRFAQNQWGYTCQCDSRIRPSGEAE